MNRKFPRIFLLALSVTYVAGCGGSSSHTPPNVVVSFSQLPPGILAPAATAPIAANVLGDSSNSGVTWSCTPANACGSFSTSPTPSGTSTTYMAPGTAGSVTLIATSVANTADSASLNVNISTAAGLAGPYSFYLSGWDGQASNVYSLAGSVLIASNGSLTGEQDYNDGSGLTSPEPGGDMITSGSLWINPANGQGFLTLITNNANLGINGTETLALNFVNSNHALIIQADGSATSSGSFDLQTLPSTLLAGGFSFAVSGAGNTGNTHFFGGVFTVAGTNVTNGLVDENDAGNVSTNNSFTGTLTAADTFGRGTFTGTGIANTIVYYVVGPEAIRLIDVDTNGTAVGSAFSQGSGNFTISSFPSVFSIQSNLAGNLYSAAGQISPAGGNFSGVADVNEEQVGSGSAVSIDGTYNVGTNGYGSLTITAGELGDVSALGIYAVDPNLNINDPNNSSGGGGAVVVDLDNNVAGSGVLVPQTDPSTASFAGNYALGFQDLTANGEFDFVGNATATSTALSGGGVLSDPGEQLVNQLVDPGTTFTSTLAPDTITNVGRYLLDPFTMIVADGAATINYQAVVYQASGGQLFWMENGADGNASVFGGQIQGQTLPVPLFVKAAVVNKTQKH
jgi:hypothetical protein